MNISYIEQYCSSLQEKITDLEMKLSSLPEGSLLHFTHNNKTKYYHKRNKERIYLNKNNLFLAKDLAAKQLFSFQLQQYKQELADLEQYLSHIKFIASKNPLLSPAISRLTTSYSMQEKINAWLSEPFQTNPRYPENLIFKTPSGIYVRSKSEFIIASLLSQNQIPFRYECKLVLNGQTIYPDFTIMHPSTGDLFYWEHFGLIDSEKYYSNSNSKLHTYISANIVPTHNLILTYETEKKPLDLTYVEELITYYFLK